MVSLFKKEPSSLFSQNRTRIPDYFKIIIIIILIIKKYFQPGIWGPYKDAVFPAFYLHEGGQSATGILLDHIVKTHPAYQQALEKADKVYINEISIRYPFDL